jgi:ADP-ribose pyrophosphatase YjhB (NUDIX family)
MPMSPYMAGIRAKIGNQLLEIPSVTVLTFDEQQRVLLVRHIEYDQWTTPGGAVEPDEVPADAAVREMFEETGLHVRLDHIFGVYGGPQFRTVYSNGDVVSFMMMVFGATRLSGSPRPDLEETLEVGYFARAEVPELDAQPWVIEVVENAYRDRDLGKTTPHFDTARWKPS